MSWQEDDIGKQGEAARQVKDSLKDNKAVPLEKALPITADVARILFMTSLGIFFVYAVGVLVAKIYEYRVDAHIIVVVLLSIVVTLEGLFYLVAYLTSAGGMEQSQGLTRYGRFYILRMLVIMKIGIAIASLAFTVVLLCYGFNFLSFSSPLTLGIYIMLTYAGVFILCIFVPGLCYIVKTCVSARKSLLEWRAVQVILIQVSLMAVTLALAVLCMLFGRLGAGVIFLTLALLLMDCLLINYERQQVAKCFRGQEKHHYSKLYWVLLFLHIPAWLILFILA